MIETDDLTEDAVLWEAAEPDEFGKMQCKLPVDIKTRWETETTLPANPDSNSVMTITTVWVDRAVPLESILTLGLEASLPDPLGQLYKVVAYSEIPDVKGLFSRRSLTVSRFYGQLPSLVG